MPKTTPHGNIVNNANVTLRHQVLITTLAILLFPMLERNKYSMLYLLLQYSMAWYRIGGCVTILRNLLEDKKTQKQTV